MLLACGTLAGCGSDELESPTAVNLKAIGRLYLDCAVVRNGHGPATERDFKKHLRGLPAHVIQSNDMDPKDLDATFVSDRDQQPFVVRYGVVITQISGRSAPLVAHEKTGKNGRKLIAFANGKVDQVDEDGLARLLADLPEVPPAKS